MSSRSAAAKKGAATKKQIQKAAKDASAVAQGGAAIASLAVSDAAEAVRQGLEAQPDLCLVVHHCLVQGTLRSLMMAPRQTEQSIGKQPKLLGQSTRKFKNMPLYLVHAAVAKISPLTMDAWMESEEEWDLLEGLAHVLHASRDTVLPHVGHPDLAAMPKFLQAIAKRYDDMGCRLKDTVWSKQPLHWVLQMDEMCVKFQAGTDTASFKVFLPVPAPADVSIENPEHATRAQIICPSL
eukprot:4782168-Amphidinium_carterae.1